MTMQEKHNRAQFSTPLPLITGAIALVIISIVLLFGLDIANQFAAGINETAYEKAANETVTPEPGYGPPLVPLGVVVFLAVMIGGVICQFKEAHNTPDQSGGKDKITLLKEQYVDGEIQTTVKLEKELSEHVEPYLDDSDVQELDDLLDNGDDTE